MHRKNPLFFHSTRKSLQTGLAKFIYLHPVLRHRLFTQLIAGRLSWTPVMTPFITHFPPDSEHGLLQNRKSGSSTSHHISIFIVDAPHTISICHKWFIFNHQASYFHMKNLKFLKNFQPFPSRNSWRRFPSRRLRRVFTATTNILSYYHQKWMDQGYLIQPSTLLPK